jgi:cobalamin biosynthesis Mg chelatase CobN
VPFMKTAMGMFGGLMGGSAQLKALKEVGFDKVSDEDLKPLFDYLEFCLKQIVADNEVGALLNALDGRYIVPGPGGGPSATPTCCPRARTCTAWTPSPSPPAPPSTWPSSSWTVSSSA